MMNEIVTAGLMKVLQSLALAGLGVGLVNGALAEDSSAWIMKTNALVTSSGVFLEDVAIAPEGVKLPHVRLAAAPNFGESATYEPAQLTPLIQAATQLRPGTNWLGAPRIVISRRSRALDEFEVQQLLTDKLSKDYLSQGGELELRLLRQWTDALIPDEPFEMKILQMPAQGIMQSFSVRFEIGNGTETFGSWQVAVHASLWKEVWVASRRMKRGEVLSVQDLGREKRDVLLARNHLEVDSFEVEPNTWELAENLAGGSPLNRWSVRRKPVVYRGQMADALVQNGALTISLRVQVLEDAIPGQSVRIRNPNTKRELQGKVNSDQTIEIQL
ncbi:flagellar basal body P-ring formation protein FlgA [bacterium]|nr:flagellar basal body P-ring formation protein FlgA [bacterium]